MLTDELLRELSGEPDPLAAARVLSSRARSLVEPATILGPSINNLPWNPKPVSLRSLMSIGRQRGVSSYELGAALASEAELVPLDSGGFRMRVLRLGTASRTRYSVAHEIGHTFFYDLSCSPPKRLTPYDRQGGSDPRVRKCTELEERFCDEFARELLFPHAAAQTALADCQQVCAPAEVLATLERVSKEWGVSVQLVLRQLNDTWGIPPELLCVVLRRVPHIRTRLNPAIRVAVSFPRPSRGWFIPTNQRAASVGLKGAVFLHDWWQQFPERRGGRTYRRSGVFGLDFESGEPTVLENEYLPGGKCPETLLVWMKGSSNSPWRHVAVQAPVTYRFYAVNPTETYTIAVVDLSRGVSQLRFGEANIGGRDRRTSPGAGPNG